MTSGLCTLLSWLAFFAALRGAETGGHPDPFNAVGDNGRSVGPYQISRAYQLDSGIAGDPRDQWTAEQIIWGYMRRYQLKAMAGRDWETLARTHNGGPRGHKKRATLPYWRKVKLKWKL